MNKPLIQTLAGVWRRHYIRRANGEVDATTKVWWVQGPGDFADLRIPDGRPDFSDVQSFDDCSVEQKAWLRQQKGFAGVLAPEGDAWVWHHELNIQSGQMSARDIGTLRFEDVAGNILIEDGVDAPYSEKWERIDDASSTGGRGYSLRSDQGLMVVAGRHFLMARNSGEALLEISHGGTDGAMDTWVITESTLPWREGHKLFSHEDEMKPWRPPVAP